MNNYKTLITMVGLLLIAGVFFVFFFSSLISTIKSNKYKAQEERQVLLQ